MIDLTPLSGLKELLKEAVEEGVTEASGEIVVNIQARYDILSEGGTVEGVAWVPTPPMYVYDLRKIKYDKFDETLSDSGYGKESIMARVARQYPKLRVLIGTQAKYMADFDPTTPTATRNVKGLRTGNTYRITLAKREFQFFTPDDIAIFETCLEKALNKL